MSSSSCLSRCVCAALVAITLAGCVRPSPSLKVHPPLPRPRSVFVSPLPLMDIPLPLSWHVYMPIAASGNPPVIDTDASCFLNDKALALFRLIRDDPRQQRTQLTCNKALVAAAQKRAQGLANGDPWSHTDAAGVTPNQYARAAGCKLPDFYPIEGNSIESIGAGAKEAARAFQSLVDDSPSHRRHLMAETPFFREQTMIGIGYAEGAGTQYTFYWVVFTGVCE